MVERTLFRRILEVVRAEVTPNGVGVLDGVEVCSETSPLDTLSQSCCTLKSVTDFLQKTKLQECSIQHGTLVVKLCRPYSPAYVALFATRKLQDL